MKFLLLIIAFLILNNFSANSQPLNCADVITINSAIGIEVPDFEINVLSYKYTGGTCGSIEANGSEINGNSTFDLNISLALGLDEFACALTNGEPPSISDIINIDPSYQCNYNILNITGQISAYALTFLDDLPYEKKVSGTVNRTDVIQIYTPMATTIELPLTVSATLVAGQTFCEPDVSVAEAKASITGTFAGATETISGIATIAGALLDNQYPSVTKVISTSVPAGISTFQMELSGEISARSKVLSVSNFIACASNAGATGDITVGRFTGQNGGPLPEGTTIIGLNSGIDYVNLMDTLTCLNIHTPNIVVESDSCNLGLGSAIVTNSIDDLIYEWSNGIVGTQIFNLIAGEYILTISDSLNCSREFQVFIDDLESPTIVLPLAIEIEENDTLLLSATDGTTAGLNILWSTGEITDEIAISEVGNYDVTITTSSGCEYVASTEVYLKETCVDFASEIIEFMPCSPDGNFTDPTVVLGEPDYIGVDVDYPTFVALGNEGVVYTGFCDNLMINSGSSAPDLTIFEIGNLIEGTSIELRPFDVETRLKLIESGLEDLDGDGYYFIKNVEGGTTPIDIDDIAEGYERESLKFNAVKITDMTNSACTGNTPGADIDAVSFLSTQCNGDGTNYCMGINCALQMENEIIECLDNGSYLVHIPVLGNTDSTMYTAFDQINFFNEIDAVQFIDYGPDTITVGPYLPGRDYQIELTGGQGFSNCNFVVEGSASCTFSESCNLSATFNTECIENSQIISVTIIGGTSPYSIFSNDFSAVLFPNDGNTFEFNTQGCSADVIDFTITDFNMCQYNEIITSVKTPIKESTCLESIVVSPNPVASFLNVSVPNICYNTHINLYDVQHKRLKSFSLVEGSNTLNVQDLKKGIYYVHLKNDKNSIIKKIVRF